MTTIVKDKRFFLTQTPPPGYIAGIGRGAVGFTTRSDIGSARNTEPDVPGFGFQSRGGADKKEDDDDDEEYGGRTNFDEFEGDRGDRFGDSSAYDAEDREADDIWDSIDRKMDSRRRSRREAKEKEEKLRIEQERPKIQEQLLGLRQGLSTISEEEWSSLPDAGALVKRSAKKREIYVPAPDSLIERAKIENETFSVLPNNGFETPGTMTTDLTQVGSARKTVLDLKLTQISDSVSGKTCVDPKGYLTDLKSKRIATDTEVGDIKKARLLFKSVVATNPKHAPGWIAAAKLEVLAGKMGDARKIISHACKECPESEEIWIENANLQTPENAKAVLSQAVKIIPHSVKIWLYAANLEKQLKMKKKVLRRALEFIPSSVKLWKEAIELEEPEDARILLDRAVECVPDNVELWLALANLETYKRAREVLNKARQAIPSSAEIWIAAAQLEESSGKSENVYKVIKKAIKSLSSNIMVMDREKWIAEAEKSEKNNYIITCQAIILETIGMGIDDDERKRIWSIDAEECISRGSIKTASAIYSHTLSIFPHKKSIWFKVAQLEKTHGTKESLDQTLQKAIKFCPHFETLWLMYAKEKWVSGDVVEARKILTKAFESNPGSEDIWLAAVKIESEMNEIKIARGLLQRARETAPTERVWMKSALLEREFGGDSKTELSLLEQGLQKFPKSFKLWLMKMQLFERTKAPIQTIREVYKQALLQCPNSTAIWIESARIEKQTNNANRARSQLELAKIKNPKDQDIYLELSRLEDSLGNRKEAQNALAVGLQQIPDSGKLWAESIHLEPRHSQKTKCLDALKKCNSDPHVFKQVSKIFWFDGKNAKAKEWFERVVTYFPKFGDGWAWFYTFTLKTSPNPEEAKQIFNKCVEAEPNLGEDWIKVSKAIGNTKLKTDSILKQVSINISQSLNNK